MYLKFTLATMRTKILQLKLLFLLVWAFQAQATHNRAGEITYKRISPFTKVISGGQVVPVFTYSITITKYTNHGNLIADRPIDTVYFGDGESAVVRRINGPTGCGTFEGQPIGCGDIIITEADYVVKLNIYSVIHTYNGQGNFIIRTLDPNRNAGVKNIPNSDNYPFYIESMLKINFFTGANSSPVFTYRPIDKACLGVCFEHNPGAYDPDGDSLSFEITTSRGKDGKTVPFYSYPYPSGSGVPNSSYSIDPVTGSLSWCSPGTDPGNPSGTGVGEYNLAFIVYEWRKNTNKVYEKIGYVLRDMQVLVGVCNANRPPSIEVPPDICIEAGKTVTATLVVRDPNHQDVVTVEGGGGSFEADPPISTFSPKSGTTFTNSGSSFNVLYSWNTNCDHIRSQQYVTTFKVLDSGFGSDVKLASFSSFRIKVIPPSVKNVTAVPSGATMKISWAATTCIPKNNALRSYKIYRKEDCIPYTPDPCNLISPESVGFKFIDSVGFNVTSFVDNNNGDGLVIGQDYTYLVLAEYLDGSRSAGSSPVCARLKRDVPVILNVDVDSTDTNNGIVWVRWTRPKVTPGNLDTSVFKGPYRFVLKYKDKPTGTASDVFITSNPVLSLLDTSFTHSGINTVDNALEYVLEFYSDNVLVGSSQKAGSVFLQAKPSDRKIDLTWSAKTPWNNTKYTIKRRDSGSNGFQVVATTTLTSYSDTVNVFNDSTYCYQIISEGAYSDPSIFKPLENASQKVCAMAVDLTPPVSPTMEITAECPIGFVKVSWNDISKLYGSDDVYQYELYFKPTVNEPYKKIATVLYNQALSYTYDDTSSISGCYAVRAIDKRGNVGDLSPDFCIDNCPVFELPNIFSPNGDDANDFYQAIKVRQIKEIDLAIVDRWGHVVYTTNDPYFKWNGVSTVSKVQVSEGTFFYVCKVFEPRLKGITTKILKGTIQVVR